MYSRLLYILKNLRKNAIILIMKFVLAGLGVFFVVLIGVIFLAGDNGDPDATLNVTQEEQVIFDSIGETTTVSYLMQGQLRGEDKRRSVRITVNRNTRLIEEIAGYNNKIVNTKEYPNTQEAFGVFARGLETYGFIKTRTSKIVSENGVCPFGTTHIFEAAQANEQVLRSWTTNCRDSIGTFAGNTSSIQRLFKKQISDYREFTKNIDF